MATPDTVSLLAHFATLEDPRQHAKVLYPLPDVSVGVNPRINGAPSSRDRDNDRPCHGQGGSHRLLGPQCAWTANLL